MTEKPPPNHWSNLVTIGMLCVTLIACVWLATR